jgi:hypothetical protein
VNELTHRTVGKWTAWPDNRRGPRSGFRTDCGLCAACECRRGGWSSLWGDGKSAPEQGVSSWGGVDSNHRPTDYESGTWEGADLQEFLNLLVRSIP